MDSPFRLTIQDKTFKRVGWLGDPITVKAVPQHNAQGVLEVTASTSNAKLPLLMEPGARIMCDYRGDHLLGGPIRLKSGRGPHTQGEVTFIVHDDFRLLARILGWPVPGAAITAQTSEYHTVSGPAETVLKTLVEANAVTRLGLPVSVAPDQGRGSAITASLRMHPLADELLPALDTAGIGVRVIQAGAGFTLDAYTPRVYPRELTEASGVVTSWEWQEAAPEGTRGVVGGQGEGTARQFTTFQDAARESEWGDVVEVFRDARDSGDGDVHAQRAAETLAETAPTVGLKLTLSETQHFRYGTEGVLVGDLVTLRVGPSLAITDVLRTAELTWTRDSGLTVTPTVGSIETNPSRVLAAAIRRTAQAVRKLRSR